MLVVFRADASLQIGTGHVMRCLTLADALTAKGSECHFICREHSGNLTEFIRTKGYQVHLLKMEATALLEERPLPHGDWLGATQEQDANVCADILQLLQPDWLVLDHYALDARWEGILKPFYQRLMVIDDLADRPHDCDLLLDQTFGRDPGDYKSLVPEKCTLLCGAHYALLRPEFAEQREYSLQRRTQPQLRQLLITMGGVDKDNVTGWVLTALRSCKLPAECQITVVMGTTAPWLDDIHLLAVSMPWPTTVKVGVSNMAELMAGSDLAIGAAGATTWERCALGLPTVMLVLAENQRQIAQNLASTGAIKLLPDIDAISESLTLSINDLSNNVEELLRMSKAAAKVVDGLGLSNTIAAMEV